MSTARSAKLGPASSTTAMTPTPVSKLPAKTHVNFNNNGDKDVNDDRKKRYLTAKYGQHQMNLIKKRLKVEMWMYDELQTLFQTNESYSDFDIDLDEILDMDDEQRIAWLQAKLVDAKKSKESVDRFIAQLLEQVKTL